MKLKTLVCLNPPPTPQGVVSSPSFSEETLFFVGDSIVYNCTNQLFGISDNVALCLANGSWSPSTIDNCQQIRKQEKKTVDILKVHI